MEDLFVGGETNEPTAAGVVISGVAPTAEGKSGGGECGGEIGVDVGGVEVVGEMFEVFAGSSEDGSGQSKGNRVVGGDHGLDSFDGNDF